MADSKNSVINRIFSRRVINTSGANPSSSSSSSSSSFNGRSRMKLGRCRIEDFELGRILGTGSFGRVYLTRRKNRSDAIFATKALGKALILRQKQLDHVKAEKGLLEMIDSPFIVNLVGFSQDEAHIYLLMDYVSGGEFFTYLRNMRKFDEDTARFYAAQVLLAFEYIHSRDVVYRDLKPENILLNDKGNIKLADFGFAKKIDTRTYTLCGTPDYLAPEVILGKGHGKPVDWWAFGVLIYEMLAGFAPFYDNDPMQTYQKILSGKIVFPQNFSRSAKDLIRKLLTAELSKRLGCLKGGVADIKNHSWFANVNWENMMNQRESPPIQPKVKGPDDTSNFDDYSDLGKEEFYDVVLTTQEQELFKDM